MIGLRNPFRMRASESITSDQYFLSLFAPGALDSLPAHEGLWEMIQIIRSAPGGGKTSLLRLFTPSSLLALYRNRASEGFQDLYRRLEGLGAIDDTGVRVLGILLPCEPAYASLEDLEIDTARKDRLLFSLINSRLIIAAIKGLLELRGLSLERDSTRVTLQSFEYPQLFLEGSSLMSGGNLLSLASETEQKVCHYLDSLLPNDRNAVPGHDAIFWDLFKPSSMSVDKKPIVSHSIIMFDDIHKLARRQRARLLRVLFDSRPKVGIWLSERYQALDPREIIDGAKSGREYGTAELEKTWRNRPKQFHDVVMDIADRRVRVAKDVDMSAFGGQLEDSLDGPKYHDVFRKSIEDISTRIEKNVGQKTLYDDWIASRRIGGGTLREQAIDWRALEIIIERDIKGLQKRLFDAPLPQNEMERAEDSAVKHAAWLFLAMEYRLPYYFGADALAKLASFNIEQFLRVAGDEFEEIAGAHIIRHPNTQLTPARQDRIIRNAAEGYWNEIADGIAYTMDTRMLVESIGRFGDSETNRPSAPYGAGVTGIGIRERETENLSSESFVKRNSQYQSLQIAIASALANNLLEPTTISQGGDTWTVLYLNRLLCVRFNLPLHYGGWRHKDLDHLTMWTRKGFSYQDGRRAR